MTELEQRLKDQLAQMKDYIQMRLDMEDWHGVQDAASDIREILAKMEMLKELKNAST